jgi:hypothetical protein
MAIGKKRNGQVLEHFLLTHNGFRQFGKELLLYIVPVFDQVGEMRDLFGCRHS